MDFVSAKWIWVDQSAGNAYHQCAVFRRDFTLEAPPEQAELFISADSFYRLKVNGVWLGDGPGRAYPSHYMYDRIELTGYLRPGMNLIEATVLFYGFGNFHMIPQRGGLLAELVMQINGATLRIGSDAEWKCYSLAQWHSDVPPNSIQRPPAEYFDNSRAERGDVHSACVICAPEEGPWKNLAERDCRYLTRKEFLLKRFCGASRVEPEMRVWCWLAQQLYFAGDMRVNTPSSFPLFAMLEIVSPKSQDVALEFCNLVGTVNGCGPIEGKLYHFNEGSNQVAVATENLHGHAVVCELGVAASSGLELAFGSGTLLGLTPELAKIAADTPQSWASQEYRARTAPFKELRTRVLQCGSVEEFRALLPQAREFRKEEFLRDECAFSFEHRVAEEALPGDVEEPAALIYGGGCCTVVHPAEGRDIELCYDFGEQNIGYWSFALFAPAGTVVDLAAVEYITPDGMIQHTGASYRNSMRYVCREGLNRYISFQRRSGRYLFLTLRNLSAPVRIQSVRLAESTYPVIEDGSFECSDFRLGKVYEISQRTLKLCMEDTFTDCPLYEQTLWVGDARSESLFAMSSFGAYDLIRRCIRIAGQSLETLPIVGSQVPSGWNNLIPAWSFMWGLSVLDYCRETGDWEFVREVWPMVKRNISGALAMVDPGNGLFKSEGWNFFDWCGTDGEHPYFLVNSFFLAAALQAAAELAPEMEDADFGARCVEARTQLIKALDKVWDARRLAWPDWVDEDGTTSESSAIHTHMLALLYDAALPERLATIRANVLTERPELTQISSPFASFYYYQTLEKLDLPEQILAAMLHDYLPMLERGATTVWESYANSSISSRFPTRSHCHAWSAVPLYYLPRLVLGIVPESNGRKYRISPWINDLDWARGSRPTPWGRIELSWRKSEEFLSIEVKAPAGIEVEFATNRSIKDREVSFSRI